MEAHRIQTKFRANKTANEIYSVVVRLFCTKQVDRMLFQNAQNF